jgi:hypothetical protein
LAQNGVGLAGNCLRKNHPQNAILAFFPYQRVFYYVISTSNYILILFCMCNHIHRIVKNTISQPMPYFQYLHKKYLHPCDYKYLNHDLDFINKPKFHAIFAFGLFFQLIVLATRG